MEEDEEDKECERGKGGVGRGRGWCYRQLTVCGKVRQTAVVLVVVVVVVALHRRNPLMVVARLQNGHESLNGTRCRALFVRCSACRFPSALAAMLYVHLRIEAAAVAPELTKN